MIRTCVFSHWRAMEIKRDPYLNKLIRKMNTSMIKIITGIRRCGKSYLLNRPFHDYLIQRGSARTMSSLLRLIIDRILNCMIRISRTDIFKEKSSTMKYRRSINSSICSMGRCRFQTLTFMFPVRIRSSCPKTSSRNSAERQSNPCQSTFV